MTEHDKKADHDQKAAEPVATDDPTTPKPNDEGDLGSAQEPNVTAVAEEEPHLNPDSAAANTVSEQTFDEAKAATDPKNVV